MDMFVKAMKLQSLTWEGNAMGTCHYCFNCGRCRGETPPGVYVRRCPSCGFKNESGAKECAKCGASLYLDPNVVLKRSKRSAPGAGVAGEDDA